MEAGTIMMQATTFGITRLIAVAVAAAPFVGAVVAYAVGHSPQPLAREPQRPALAFEQYMVDLGEVSPTEEVFARFRFTNIGSSTVTIREWVPSCGCLNPQLGKQVYEPHESGEFRLRVQTANELPGAREYTLTVKYDDVQPREARLVFRVVLPQDQVIVRPPALIFYQWSDKPTIQDITVTDRRAQPLEVEGVRCSSKAVDVQVGERERDEFGHYRTKVRVTVPGNIPAGRFQAQVTIFTSDPAYHELRVPLIVNSSPGTGRR